MTDNSPTDGAPVDQALAERVSKLYEEVDETLASLKVPPQEKKEIEQNLMSAVAADLLTRLGSQLTDEQKKEFAALAGDLTDAEPDLAVVAEFFRTIFPKDVLVNEVALATESVLKDFLREMEF